jgi:hypothetical protein
VATSLIRKDKPPPTRKDGRRRAKAGFVTWVDETVNADTAEDERYSEARTEDATMNFILIQLK